MKIIVAGDGKVGATLTRQLTAEGYDITLIDSNKDVLSSSMEQFDIMTVHGNCATKDTLLKAGITDTDLRHKRRRGKSFVLHYRSRT